MKKELWLDVGVLNSLEPIVLSLMTSGQRQAVHLLSQHGSWRVAQETNSGVTCLTPLTTSESMRLWSSIAISKDGAMLVREVVTELCEFLAPPTSSRDVAHLSPE